MTAPTRPRRLASLVLAAGTVLALTSAVADPQPALASKPFSTPVSSSFLFPTFSCGFLVMAEQSGGDGTLRSFSGGRSVLLAAADTVITLTGPSGRTAVVRTSGPSFYSASGTTIVLTGWTILDAIVGRDPGLYTGTGRTVIDTATGTVRASGHFVDVCSRLAPA